MRELYDTRGPGKFEGEPPIVCYLWEHSEFSDQEDGTSESPTGWFCRMGKWVLVTTSNGFVYGKKHATYAAAIAVFDAMQYSYSEWNSQDDDNTDDSLATWYAGANGGL